MWGVGRKVLSDGSSLWRAGLDFVYPPACALCAAPLHAVSDGVVDRRLCPGCRTELTPAILNRCARCSAPVGPYLDTSQGCVHCRSDRFAFQRVVSLGVYEGALRTACLMAKAHGGAPLATGLAELLWLQGEVDLRALGADVVVPVPHHWTSRIRHGHFPPVTIGRALARRLKARWHAHILAKVRRTSSQVSLPVTDRRNNLRGAFRVVGGSRLNGMTVLLVDDVLTTGTTAHRAATELNKAGASRVLVAVVARAIVHAARQ
jgi:predicted amidophosphoribosyltransferase